VPGKQKISLVDGTRAFLKIPNIHWIIAYLMTIRLGEGILSVVKGLFFLDQHEAGGMAMSLQQIGVIGSITFLPAVFGGVVGGLMIQRWTLQRMMMPCVLMMNLPNLLIVWLSLHPTIMTDATGPAGGEVIVVMLAGLESFFYGVAFASVQVLIMEIVKGAGANKSSFAAFLGALQLLGFVIPGMISGLIQQSLGYFWTFQLSIGLGLTCLLVIRHIPHDYIGRQMRLHGGQ
jgi:PAT family beta-lactamase induction signal transducer AmpG